MAYMAGSAYGYGLHGLTMAAEKIYATEIIFFLNHTIHTFLYYFYFRYILLRLLIEVRYRPGGTRYFEHIENFYSMCKK